MKQVDGIQIMPSLFRQVTLGSFVAGTTALLLVRQVCFTSPDTTATATAAIRFESFSQDSSKTQSGGGVKSKEKTKSKKHAEECPERHFFRHEGQPQV